MYTTNDIGIAAFLMLKNLQLKSCSIEDGGKYVFEFSDPSDLGTSLSIEYLNSECSKFDNQVKNLRKILNSLKK